MSKSRNRRKKKTGDRRQRGSQEGSDHDDDGHQVQDLRYVGNQEERQLRQYIRDGQIRERDHREDQMRQLAEDSQLGQPSQGLRGNAGAG